MSENQDKIKFERTTKDTWSKLTDTEKQSHNNSIVFIESSNENDGTNQIWSNGRYYGIDIVKDKKETNEL